MGKPRGRMEGAIKDCIRKKKKNNVIKKGKENLGMLSDKFYSNS